MSLYLNPEIDGTWDSKQKMEYIVQFEEIPKPSAWPVTKEGYVVVCAVLNPAFIALGIICNRQDFEAFTYYEDRRPQRWFVVPEEEIEKQLGSIWTTAKETGRVQLT